ncbi:hypothetical protein ACA910_010148 [Epithemia clementina (nom. ined.)]
MQHTHQKVFADFLQKIDNKDGWWYRVPMIRPSSGERPIIPQDCIMPHFGMVFGLSEDAAAIVLESMGLLSLNVSKGETKVFKDMWDDFCGLHQIANTSMEVQKAICMALLVCTTWEDVVQIPTPLPYLVNLLSRPYDDQPSNNNHKTKNNWRHNGKVCEYGEEEFFV